MSNDIVAFESELMERKELWAPALPPTIQSDRFKSVVISAVTKNPSLLRADRQSLIVACTQAAHDGLLPDGRDGAITAFRDRRSGSYLAQWMPMVAGILKRCREKGELTSISAYCVYKQDEFEVVLGDEPKILHKPDFLAQRSDKDIVLAYAIFRNGDEVVHREFMTRDEIEHTRSVSRARDGNAWKDWYGEMCRKTVVRRGSKSVPLSSDLAQIIEREDQWVDVELRDVAKEEINPLNDSIVTDVEVVGNGNSDPNYEELLAKLESCQTLDELNAFATENIARLKALDAVLLDRIRFRYRELQNDVREQHRNNNGIKSRNARRLQQIASAQGASPDALVDKSKRSESPHIRDYRFAHRDGHGPPLRKPQSHTSQTG